MELKDLAIIGQFPRKRMGGETLKYWMQENFEAMLGYPPCNMVLVKGWMVWILRYVPNANNILNIRWKWGSQPIFLKKQIGF
jgi:hypothetical protein